MKCKNEVWISLVCGIVLACVPVLAHGARQDAPPPPPPNGQQPGSQPGLPPRPHLDRDDWAAQRTVSGPYRLAFTITEMDGDKRVNSQHYVVAADADAPPTELRLGTKIPIETAASLSGGAGVSPTQTEITYIDIGLKINVRLRQFANGLELSSNVSQSAVDSQQALPRRSPVIRQTSLESTVLLTENKPTIIGMMDELGSTRRFQVEVELTKIP
jgi:hypothetical protein